MKQRRITLKRDLFGGTLRTKGYYTTPNSTKPDFGLCDSQLNDYFDITKADTKVDLVLSTKECVDSYAVRQHSPDHIEGEDPNDTVWVDNELAAMIGKYATAAKQEFIYLSFEFPKGC